MLSRPSRKGSWPIPPTSRPGSRSRAPISKSVAPRSRWRRSRKRSPKIRPTWSPPRLSGTSISPEASRWRPSSGIRYRGISGDRRLDAVITRLQGEVAPAPVTPRAGDVAPLPPPPSFRATPLDGTARPRLPSDLAKPYGSNGKGDSTAAREKDPNDISGITYERPVVHFPAAAEPEVPSRDVSLDAMNTDGDEEIVTRKIRLPEATWPHEPSGASAPGLEAPQSKPLPAAESGGRALADLYFEQGHFWRRSRSTRASSPRRRPMESCAASGTKPRDRRQRDLSRYRQEIRSGSDGSRRSAF